VYNTQPAQEILMASLSVSLSTPPAEFIAGARATLPLIVGGIPFGIIFGALAITSGMSPGAALMMSLLVYAGSAQFIGVNLFAAGAAIPLIVLTTFIVNVRHALYAATLAPHVRHLPIGWLLPLGFMLTDETFVVVIQHYAHDDSPRHKHWFYLGSALAMYISWTATTLIGIIAGGSIDNPERWGLDFAMSATFIGIVVPAIKTRPILAAVVTAGFVAMIANPLPYKLGLIAAALAGVAAGVIAEMLSGRAADAQPDVSPDSI